MHHGEELKKFIKDKKITKEQVGDVLNTDRGNVYKLFAKEKFSLDIRTKLENEFGKIFTVNPGDVELEDSLKDLRIKELEDDVKILRDILIAYEKRFNDESSTR